MRRLDRYTLRDFLLYSLMGLILFIGIYILVDVFERLDTFVDHKTALSTVIRYYLWGLPLIILQVVPVAVLLGSMLSLGQLRRFNEITAMQGAGVSPARIALPLLAAALAISSGVYAMSETLVPDAYHAQRRILQEEVKGERSESGVGRLHVRYLGRGNTFYAIEFFDGSTGSLRNVSVQQLSGGGIRWRVDAAHGELRDGIWSFRNGFLRTFRDSTETTTQFRRYGSSSLKEKPQEFARLQENPFHMNMRSLRQYAERVRASGGRDVKIRVDYHLRISFPLSCVVMVLLGASLSLRIVRGGSAPLGFGATLAIAFAYYAFIRAGQALGYNETVPPLAAAWVANVLFSGIGWFLFWKVTR